MTCVIYLPENTTSLESFLSSLELGEDCLEPASSAGEPSDLLKTTPIVKQSCNSESKTDTCTTPQSSGTLKTSSGRDTRKPTLNTQTLSQQASRSCASHFQLQGSAKARQTTGINGLTLSESFAQYDPHTCSWKTCQLSLLTNTLEPYLETWPRVGMIVNGIAYELPTRARRINARGSGLSLFYRNSWPTPKAWDGEMGTPSTTGRPVQKVTHLGTAAKHWPKMWRTPDAGTHRNVASPSRKLLDGETHSSKGQPIQVRLVDQVEQYRFPTPSTVDGGSYFNKSKSPGAVLRPTLGAMAKYDLWPTPRKSMARGASQKEIEQGNPKGRLETEVQLWPTPRANKVDGYPSEGYSPTLRKAVDRWGTPTSRDYKDTGDSIAEGKVPTKGLLSRQVQPSKAKGALNPMWVEWLMGFPLNWTSMEPLPERHIADWMEKEYWWIIDPADSLETWEYAEKVPRIAVGVPNRVNRLKGIGNAQVPLCVFMAWKLLTVES